MSLACSATPGGKESFQLFEVGVAMLSEEGKCCWCRDYRLVRVRDMFLSSGTRS